AAPLAGARAHLPRATPARHGWPTLGAAAGAGRQLRAHAHQPLASLGAPLPGAGAVRAAGPGVSFAARAGGSGMSDTPEPLFREEALDYLASQSGPGELLRVSPRWLTVAYLRDRKST